MTIPGTGRICNMISKKLGFINKVKFEKYIYSDDFKFDNKQFKNSEKLDITIVTFVNSESISDLLLSILSFYDSVGIPKIWYLYIDDKLNILQLSALNKIPFVVIKKWDTEIDSKWHSTSLAKWQIRKYAVISSLQISNTTIITDSDIIFYPEFGNYLGAFKNNNWYLPEPPESKNYDINCVQPFLFKKEMYSVNAGFIIINNKPNWTIGYDYLIQSLSNNSNSYFLDQTALNLVFSNDLFARLLDPRIFHASANDHFQIKPLSINGLAMRHYVGLIRHKMWQLGWNKYS